MDKMVILLLILNVFGSSVVEGHAFPYQPTTSHHHHIHNFGSGEGVYASGPLSTSSTFFTNNPAFSKLKVKFNPDNALGYNFAGGDEEPRYVPHPHTNIQNQPIQSGIYDKSGIKGPFDPFHAGGRVFSLLGNIGVSKEGGVKGDNEGTSYLISSNPPSLNEGQSSFSERQGPVASSGVPYTQQSPSPHNNDNHVNVVYENAPNPIITNVQAGHQHFDPNQDFSLNPPTPTLSVISAQLLPNQQNGGRAIQNVQNINQNAAPLQPNNNNNIGVSPINQYGNNEAISLVKKGGVQDNDAPTSYPHNNGVVNNVNVYQNNDGLSSVKGGALPVFSQNSPSTFKYPSVNGNAASGLNFNQNSYFQPQGAGQPAFYPQRYSGGSAQPLPPQQPPTQGQYLGGTPQPLPQQPSGPHPFGQGPPQGTFPQGVQFPQGAQFPQGGGQGAQRGRFPPGLPQPFGQGGPQGPFPGGPQPPFPGGAQGPFPGGPEPENGYNPNHLESFPEPPYESEFLGLPPLDEMEAAELDNYISQLRNKGRRSQVGGGDSLQYRIVNPSGNVGGGSEMIKELSAGDAINLINSKPIPSKCAYNTITRGIQNEDCIEIR